MATYLANGRPVFLVPHEDGSLSVVDAFSTHVPRGVHELVAWCAEARRFHEPAHGATWDEWGAYLGGPANGSMRRFAWEAVAGAGDGLRITGDIASASNPPRGDWGMPVACFEPDKMVFHEFADLELGLPSEAIADRGDGWMLLRGWADAAGGRLCDDLACRASAPVRGLTAFTGNPPSRLSLYIAHARDGALVDLTSVVNPPGD